MAVKTKALPKSDFSGWTFEPLDAQGNPVQSAAAAPTPSQAIATTIQQDVQGAPKAQPAGPPPPPEADMTKQTPHDFATLAANKAIEDMRQQNATPLVEDFKKVYQSAFEKALDFQKTLVTQQQQQQMELQKSTALQESAAKIDIAKTAAIKQFEMPLEEAQKAREAQTAEGLTDAQAQAQWESSGGKGPHPLIKATPTTELDKAAGFMNGYKTVSDLHAAHTAMINKAFGTGGLFNIGDVAAATSPEAKLFNSITESSLVPLAKGVFGDTGATAGKDVIQAQMKDALPNVSDNDLTSGQKIYMLKKRIIDNLQTQRDLLAGHYDTSVLDTQLASMHKDLNSLDKYNPFKDQSAVVQTGLSSQGNAHLNSVVAPNAQQPNAQQPNAQQPNAQQPNAQPAAVTQPPQPVLTPQQQHEQAVQAAKNFPGGELQYLGSKGSGALQSAGKTIGSGINFMQGLLPENWDPSVFNHPSQGTTGGW